MKLPVIDFSTFDLSKPDTLLNIAKKMEATLTNKGFMSVSNLDITPEQVSSIFATSRAFFSQTETLKNKSKYGLASENFGYQGLGAEYLDPKQNFDLKETFTMRNLLHHDVEDDRWPSPAFRDEVTRFYRDCLTSAMKLQQVFSIILGVPSDYFVKYHNGENVTLRLLHYPQTGHAEEGQLGAGAHTDYGMLTLLFQDNIGGLQVFDNGAWSDVEPVENAIVVNTGDLMERWTNGRFKSTLHRVLPRMDGVPRSSIAVFVDPDSDTIVQVLDSCIDEEHPRKYESITAGEHIQSKISATHLSDISE